MTTRPSSNPAAMTRPSATADRPAHRTGPRMTRATPSPAPRGFWIAVASRDHVLQGAAQGFVQVSHGKAGPLERMAPGDGLVYYSPREQEHAGATLMAFTAIARVLPGEIFQAMAGGQSVFRRHAVYLEGTPAPVKPLLESLTFIRSKTHWGAAFRFGFLRIPEHDFACIAFAMGCDPGVEFPPLPFAPQDPPP